MNYNMNYQRLALLKIMPAALNFNFRLHINSLLSKPDHKNELACMNLLLKLLQIAQPICLSVGCIY